MHSNNAEGGLRFANPPYLLGSISCRGDSYLRTLLIQGARSSLQRAKAVTPEKATHEQIWIQSLAARQQNRLRKCSLASVEPHRFDESDSNKRDNTMISNSLKAQGKSVMHPVLTEVSLRNC